jgi:hypothetical protein
MGQREMDDGDWTNDAMEFSPFYVKHASKGEKLNLPGRLHLG